MRLMEYIDAADLAGVSRQAIQKLSRKRWGFFIDDCIDIDHPDWQRYLDKPKPGGARAKKDIVKKGKLKTGRRTGKKIVKKKQ